MERVWATDSRDELAIAPCPAISKSWLRRGYGPLEEIRGLNMVLADLKVEYLASQPGNLLDDPTLAIERGEAIKAYEDKQAEITASLKVYWDHKGRY